MFLRARTESEQVVPLLRRAVELDPDWAKANHHLAEALFADIDEYTKDLLPEDQLQSASIAYETAIKLGDKEDYQVKSIFHTYMFEVKYIHCRCLF
jgi:hypothetical protein